MLSLPEFDAGCIQAWSENNIPDEFLAASGRERYSHCTILYGFPQDVEFSDVESFINYEYALTDETRIDIRLGKVKRFTGNPAYDVLVIEVSQALMLRQMHHSLKDKFNVKTDYPTYNPHVTLAYVTPGTLTHLDGATTFLDLDLTCDKMTYSTGPSGGRRLSTLRYENPFKKA